MDKLGHLDLLGLQEDVSSIKLPINSAFDTKTQWIWWTRDQKCKVYINFRDHLAVVASQSGGDIQATFKIWSKLLQCLETNLKTMKQEFLVSKKYGFLTTLLQDVGRGLRVEAKVKLPCLGKVRTAFHGDNTLVYKPPSPTTLPSVTPCPTPTNILKPTLYYKMAFLLFTFL